MYLLSPYPRRSVPSVFPIRTGTPAASYTPTCRCTRVCQRPSVRPIDCNCEALILLLLRWSRRTRAMATRRRPTSRPWRPNCRPGCSARRTRSDSMSGSASCSWFGWWWWCGGRVGSVLRVVSGTEIAGGCGTGAVC